MRLNGLRDYKLYIADIEEAIKKIQLYIEDLEFDDFRNDSKTYDSVIHNLFIIGEAANKIPSEIQIENPEIDWRAIVGMRNIIAHGYFSIKSGIIWKTITEEIPILQGQIKKIK